MVGQERLIQHIMNMVETGTLPRFLVISGGRGGGKTMLAHMIAKAMGAEIYVPFELKVEDMRQVIENSQSLSTKQVFLISNVQDMTIQGQNAILKFLEEPPENAYIIMTTTGQLLATIRSRATVLKLEPYTDDELQNFTDDLNLMGIGKTPGNILRYKEQGYEGVLTTAKRVVDNIGKISASNAFAIMHYFTMENVDLFLDALEWVLLQKVQNGEAATATPLLVVLAKYREQIESKYMNNTNAVEMMLVELREVAMVGLPDIKERVRRW